MLRTQGILPRSGTLDEPFLLMRLHMTEDQNYTWPEKINYFQKSNSECQRSFFSIFFPHKMMRISSKYSISTPLCSSPLELAVYALHVAVTVDSHKLHVNTVSFLSGTWLDFQDSEEAVAKRPVIHALGWSLILGCWTVSTPEYVSSGICFFSHTAGGTYD